jgi:hypothetical protein
VKKRESSSREAKRELMLTGGENRGSAKAAFSSNSRRSSAADRPPRSKTKAANRHGKGGR